MTFYIIRIVWFHFNEPDGVTWNFPTIVKVTVIQGEAPIWKIEIL